jgi:hypothetical protein
MLSLPSPRLLLSFRGADTIALNTMTRGRIIRKKPCRRCSTKLDLNDHLQNQIENTIRQIVPDYTYGTRREDPSAIINESKLFGQVDYLERNFNVRNAFKCML